MVLTNDAAFTIIIRMSAGYEWMVSQLTEPFRTQIAELMAAHPWDDPFAGTTVGAEITAQGHLPSFGGHEDISFRASYGRVVSGKDWGEFCNHVYRIGLALAAANWRHAHSLSVSARGIDHQWRLHGQACKK